MNPRLTEPVTLTDSRWTPLRLGGEPRPQPSRDNKHVSCGGVLEDSLPTRKSGLLPELILITAAVNR